MSLRRKAMRARATGIYGRVGASLDGADFGAKGAVGAYGEKKTERILNAYGDRCGIIHDVIVPKLSANLDHVVVSGRKVLIIDTKAWKDGFYHQPPTGGVRLNGELVEHLNKGGLHKMEQMIYDELNKRVGFYIPRDNVRSVLVVWPSPKTTQLMLDESLLDRAIPMLPAYKLGFLMRSHLGLRRSGNAQLINALDSMRYDEARAPKPPKVPFWDPAEVQRREEREAWEKEQRDLTIAAAIEEENRELAAAGKPLVVSFGPTGQLTDAGRAAEAEALRISIQMDKEYDAERAKAREAEASAPDVEPLPPPPTPPPPPQETPTVTSPAEHGHFETH